MLPIHALRHAAGSLAGDGKDLGPSVAFGEGLLAGIPASTSALAGTDEAVVDAHPGLLSWVADIAAWLTGEANVDLSRPRLHAGLALWPLLSEGGGDFDARPLEGAVPRGAAWVVAMRPEHFFAQAAERLERSGDARAVAWSARLRAPTGNLAILERLVRTFAISLDPAGVLRLRVGCPNSGTARRAFLLLHGWRLRRAAGDGAVAQAFAGADLVRHDARVQMSFSGDPEVLARLFKRG